MPAIVQSTTSFSQGEITLLDHDVKVNQNGLVEVSMSFACLNTEVFAPRNLAKFGKGAVPPVTLPNDVKAVGLANNMIYLADHSVKTSNGICYINANYVGVLASFATNAQTSAPRTITTEARSFSGYGEAQVELGQNTAEVKITYAISFDYYAEVESVQYASLTNQPQNIARAIEKGRYNVKRSIDNDDPTLKNRQDPQSQLVRTISVQQTGPIYIISESADLVFSTD